MDRAILLEHLREAEEHVARGAVHVAKQRRIIGELSADGHDTTRARSLLTVMEEVQRAHIKDRDRLLETLAASPPK
jgi:hypothetical protein